MFAALESAVMLDAKLGSTELDQEKSKPPARLLSGRSED